MPNLWATLCASLRSRNACQHFARATLYENLQEKCRAREAGPTHCASLRSRNALQHFKPLYTEIDRKNARDQSVSTPISTGLYSYRKNPSVWTHCLGNIFGANIVHLYSNTKPKKAEISLPAFNPCLCCK